jgi:HPt (histidine-containing phosphotransfer) domain-containing protein
MNTSVENVPNLTAAGEAICLNGFRDAACGDENERIDLLKMYAEQLSKKLPLVESAAAGNQPGEVARVVHSLCGATFTCGLNEFGTLLRDLEQSAKTNDSAAVTANLPKAIPLAKRVSEANAAELQRCKA